MKRLRISEHERLDIGPGGRLTEQEAELLRRVDEAHARTQGTCVFDWSRKSAVAARGYVGVLQAPGVLVEVLPKTDPTDGSRGAQQNLLYMLEVSGYLRPRTRSFALLATLDAPLLDSFAIVFADGLLDAFQEGRDRTYVTFEENLAVVRGRMVFQEHLRRNFIHNERVFSRFDELSADTQLNQALKKATRRLAALAQSFQAARRLREVLSRLDDVSDVGREAARRPIVLHRQNRRFQPFLDFAQLALAGRSPALAAGDSESFSLLFSMHDVFERFVAGLFARHGQSLGLGPLSIQTQESGLYLVQGSDASTSKPRRFFRLKPDVIGVSPSGVPRFVLDTKWKVVSASNPIQDVVQSDAYQMFAYSERYKSPLTVLLYPSIGQSARRDYLFEGGKRVLRLATLPVGRNLREQAGELVSDLSLACAPTQH